jgi:hypothetical protein
MVATALRAHPPSCFRALSYVFSLHSDVPALARHLDEAFAGLREPEARPPMEHRYSLASSGGGDGLIDVLRHGSVVAPAQQPADAVGWVVCDVNRAAAEASGEHLLFHAGALDAGGIGVLVPGTSGSGKSTLVAGLTRAGLGYLTDELVALDLSSGHLLPYPKPITIKRGSFDVLPGMRPAAAVLGASATTAGAFGATDDDDRWACDEWQVAVGARTRRRIGHACPPRIIVVPRYDPDAATGLTPLSDTEAFLYLALNAVNLLPHAGPGVAAVGRLVSDCHCVALTTSDLDEACALVLGLVEEHAARVG